MLADGVETRSDSRNEYEDEVEGDSEEDADHDCERPTDGVREVAVVVVLSEAVERIGHRDGYQEDANPVGQSAVAHLAFRIDRDTHRPGTARSAGVAASSPALATKAGEFARTGELWRRTPDLRQRVCLTSDGARRLHSGLTRTVLFSRCGGLAFTSCTSCRRRGSRRQWEWHPWRT